MWHEARKQEKKIRGMMVDYRKRAERRRDFYEKFKADPTQFLQLHGRPCKIHLDPAIAVAGDSASVMMPWQGHPDILIDRFDVRAHLDTITENSSSKCVQETLSYDDRTMNYERYRILVQNEFLGVNEEKFLNQIYLEEQFGPIALKQSTEMLEKEKRKRGVAIGFTYEDSTDTFYTAADKKQKDDHADKEASDSDDSDLDFDLCLDLSQIDTPSAHEMNAVGQRFGLTGNDFFSFLTNDVEEQEAMRLARQQEEEKAMFSGRKARRERQAFREKKLLGRVMSPPSYAARKSPTYDKYNRSNRSASRSTSPENTGQITYITSFGGDDSNDEKQEGRSLAVNRTNKRSRRRSPREREDRSSRVASSRTRRSKSLGSRSRSKSPRRKRRFTRSRSLENRSLASNLKKLISKKNERSRSGSSDRFRNYSKWKSRSRSRSRRRSWSSRSRSGSSRSRRERSKSSRSASSSKKRSRSNSSKSHSRSRSASREKPKIQKRSRSRSSSGSAVSQKKESPPKIVVPRYYGRNRKDSSSSLSLDSSDSDSKTNSEQPSCSTQKRANNKKTGVDDYYSSSRSLGNARPTSKSSIKEKPQEKLKKKMQALLNKQFKADKKAEKERQEKAEQERQDREAELRDIAIKIRRRERYLRHRGEDEDNDGEKDAMRRRERYLKRLGEEDGKREKRDMGSRSDSSRSRSRSSSSDNKGRRSKSPRRSRRSRSPSPKTSRLGKRHVIITLFAVKLVLQELSTERLTSFKSEFRNKNIPNSKNIGGLLKNTSKSLPIFSNSPVYGPDERFRVLKAITLLGGNFNRMGGIAQVDQ